MWGRFTKEVQMKTSCKIKRINTGGTRYEKVFRNRNTNSSSIFRSNGTGTDGRYNDVSE